MKNSNSDSNCNDGQCDVSNKDSQCGSSSDCSDKKECCSAESMMCKLVSLAEWAKKDLLKEKMKSHLETKIGGKLDQAAELAVDSLLEMYAGHGDCEEKKSAAVEKLNKIFKS